MKIMKKSNLILAAIASVALVSCSNEEYLGEGPNTTSNGIPNAINFNLSTPAITRAEGAEAAKALDYKFKVYGVKKVGSDYSNVFATGTYSTATDYNADPVAYWAWYTTNTAGTTTSNTSHWDYVGGAGDHGTDGHKATIASGKDQTIKYWDYSADQYEFVAYSATVGTPTISKYQKDGFTVTATANELSGLYIADKLTITAKNNTPTKPSTGYNEIGNIVKFTFRAAGTKVRLGIYETIPGYDVKNVSFRPNGTITGFTAATTANAKLSGSFNGTSSAASGTYNVTYATSEPRIAIFNADNTTTNIQSGYFDFGTFASTNAIGTLSTNPTWAGGGSSPYYQGVLPNTDNVNNMTLYVDYDLVNATSGETIHVKGAKAVVPAAYMAWKPNYAYTYLFKISDNTNGTTGPTEGTSPVGLFPITFDAMTVATTDGAEVGTITTVSTPAITTYQEGSVSATGITYANANGPIYITVNTDGTLATLTAANTKLYTVADGTTEADLILTTKTKTEVTGDAALSILSTADEKQGISFAANTTAKFTPAAPVSPATSITYALEYKVSDAVAAVYGSATGTYVSGTTYYTDNTGATTVDTSSFEEGVTDVSSYYVLTTPAQPAVYQYKVIIVQ